MRVCVVASEVHDTIGEHKLGGTKSALDNKREIKYKANKNS